MKMTKGRCILHVFVSSLSMYMYELLFFFPDDGDEYIVGFWTVLFDIEVSHKTLLTVLFSILERNKSVSV